METKKEKEIFLFEFFGHFRRHFSSLHIEYYVFYEFWFLIREIFRRIFDFSDKCTYLVGYFSL